MTPARTPARTAVLWVPDWPVLAALVASDTPPDRPAAVHDPRGIVAASALARSAGVRRGMRRRRARECCPGLELFAADDARDVREFEPVAAAAETVVAGLEVARPGLLLLPADGPARFHGTEEALAEALADAVAASTGHECQVGIADGILAAVIAARDARIVPPGGSVGYLGPRPLTELVHAATVPGSVADVDALVDLWGRLGLRTFADLRELPAADVETRFGVLGAWAHRLARGADLRPPARRRIEADLVAARDLDPPADRVDTAAFAARSLAEELYALLVARSVTCGRLRIAARAVDPVDGAVVADLVRTWRCDDEALGGVSAARLTDRVRWQLEGWLTSAALAGRPSRRGARASARADDAAAPILPTGIAPIAYLELTAEDVVPAGLHQGGLWGASSGQDARARRALEHVQGVLGGEQVLAVTVQGGRDARGRVHAVPWGSATPTDRAADHPWPGRLPEPSPASTIDSPVPVTLVDPAGRPVVVSERGRMSGPPATLRACPEDDRDGPDVTGGPQAVHDWAGPWLLDERWWTDRASRRAYLQVVLGDGRAALLAGTAGTWQIEALYD